MSRGAAGWDATGGVRAAAGRCHPLPGVCRAHVPSVRASAGSRAHLVSPRFRLVCRAAAYPPPRKSVELAFRCGYEDIVTISSIMSTGDSFETRFEKIDNLLRDPKSEVNSDCLLVSAAVCFGLPWVPLVCILVNCESQVCIVILGRCQISLLQEFWSTCKLHSSGPF